MELFIPLLALWWKNFRMCGVPPPLLLKHLRIMCGVPTLVWPSDQMSILECAVSLPHLILKHLNSSVVSLAQFVSPSVALPAQLVDICSYDTFWMKIWHNLSCLLLGPLESRKRLFDIFHTNFSKKQLKNQIFKIFLSMIFFSIDE